MLLGLHFVQECVAQYSEQSRGAERDILAPWFSKLEKSLSGLRMFTVQGFTQSVALWQMAVPFYTICIFKSCCATSQVLQGRNKQTIEVTGFNGYVRYGEFCFTIIPFTLHRKYVPYFLLIFSFIYFRLFPSWPLSQPGVRTCASCTRCDAVGLCIHAP